MRLRRLAVIGAVSGSLVGAVPAAASATPAYTYLDHITCVNNANHRTASDIYLDSDHRLLEATWNTVAAFRADKISWSVWTGTSWTLLGYVGGTSSSVDDVAPGGSKTGGFVSEPGFTSFRMTVWDANWGECQGTIDSA